MTEEEPLVYRERRIFSSTTITHTSLSSLSIPTSSLSSSLSSVSLLGTTKGAELSKVSQNDSVINENNNILP